MKSRLKEIMAKTAAGAPPPLVPTAGVSDTLDRDFVGWMAEKAGEDVVKTATSLSSMSYDPKSAQIRSLQAAFGRDWKRRLAAARGMHEDNIMPGAVKTASTGMAQAVRKALEEGSRSTRAAEEAVHGLVGREKLKSLLTGTVAGSGLTAGAGALYVKGRRDQRAKTAGVIENPENLDLLAKVRAMAEAQTRVMLGG